MEYRFMLAPDVISVFPEVQIRFVVALGLRNDEPWFDLDDRLRELETSLAAETWAPFEETDVVIASWHDAYRQFGSNPRRTRPSIDSLSRRLRRNGQMPRINPAVDAYNLISVKHGTPAGAFDLATIGNVSIRFATADDRFTPLGEPEKTEVPVPGEVVYAQGQKILTRHWNHRDAEQTKVTEASRNVVFILERISEKAMPSDHLINAQLDLAQLVTPHADSVTLTFIEPETPETISSKTSQG